MTIKNSTQILQPITITWLCLCHGYEAVVVVKWHFLFSPQNRLTYLQNMRRLVSELYVRDNCHPFKATVLVWIQLPMWVCMSVALRNFSTGATHSEGSYYRSLFPPHKFSNIVFYSKEKEKKTHTLNIIRMFKPIFFIKVVNIEFKILSVSRLTVLRKI